MIKTIVLLPILYLLCCKVSAQEQISKRTFPKSITEAWDLEGQSEQGTLKITPYKPIYVTYRYSDSPNRQPFSENPIYTATEPIDYNSFEVKFQLSFKTKIVKSLLFGKGDLWLGYTQVAHWQVFNTSISRAVRELNYEPELIFTYPLNLSFAGFDIKMASVSFNHQSNGKELPLSRSWNRLIFNLALERKNLTLYLTPWIRIRDRENENPLITSFIGNGSVTAVYTLKKHTFYAIATNTFSINNNRGGLQFNYLYPLNQNLNIQAQFFSGYGETIIDYNHYQNTFGLGFSFANW